MSALLSLICPQCIVSSLSPVSLSVVSFHWPGPRYTWGIGPHCTLGAGVTLSLSRESDSDTQRVTWECVNCEYFVWIMNFDKGLAVSVMQIQNINLLNIRQGPKSHLMYPLYRGMPRICDWHYQRYLRGARYLDVILQKAQRWWVSQQLHSTHGVTSEQLTELGEAIKQVRGGKK